MKKTLAIIGGGPSALFLLRRLIEKNAELFEITIFERNHQVGPGFPYSTAGATPEHVTNVSGNEIPDMVTKLTDWLKDLPPDRFEGYQSEEKAISEYKVIPRLLFGEYLSVQFQMYLSLAKSSGFTISVRSDTLVSGIRAEEKSGKFRVSWNGNEQPFDAVVVCCGHRWPVTVGNQARSMSSPYPPSKLLGLTNQVLSLKGCSLTAVDAVRTLARVNGRFQRNGDGELEYINFANCNQFRINMFSRHAILPGLRFHLEDSHLSRKSLLSREAIQEHRSGNGGFVSLDYIFDGDFKEQFKVADPSFYEQISDWQLEDFVGAALSSFQGGDPFVVFEAEFKAALKSIKEHQSEFWKEKLAILSAAMNYPAKYFSAEDYQRLTEHLMPLISIVIAFIPQNSAEEMIALHRANKLLLETDEAHSLRQAGQGGWTIDCTGQPRLSIDQFPFPDLVNAGAVSQAKIRFKGKTGAMEVPGLAITDEFRAIDQSGKTELPLYIMAVPYIGGFNPDYSGLDFCEEAASAIVGDLLSDH